MLSYYTNSLIINTLKHALKTCNKRNFHKCNFLTCKKESGCDKSKKGSHIGETNKCKTGDSIRYKLHAECEKGINSQIKEELHASYVYSSMAIYFDRYDVALKGFSKLFRIAADEETVHARMFMQYLNMRGGDVILCPIPAPERNEWDTPLCAVYSSIQLEKHVTKSLELLHEKASKHNDLSLTDFIESHFITEQFKALKELGDLQANVKRAGSKSGLLILDHDLQEYLKSKNDWEMYNVKER